MRAVHLLLLALFCQALAQRFTVSKIANRVAASNVDFGPDGHLYAVNSNVPAVQERQSLLMRYRLDSNGVPTNVIDNLYAWGNLTDCVVGMAIDPESTPENILIYISISQDAFIYEWGGRIERITVTPNSVVREILYHGLPVGFHQINDLVFGPDGKLIIMAGSTTTSGMPGHFSNEWNEKILSAAFLKADVKGVTQPVNVQTAGGHNYNPSAEGAPMTTWVVSIRNPFDATWHSNGHFYAGTNQNDVNGDTGDCNGQTQNLKNQRPDEFLAIIRPGQTYGFPNPSRGECVLMGGNPTNAVDPWEVPDYRVGINPPSTFDPSLLYDTALIGGNSPDGIFEYQAEGPLKRRLVQAYYGWDGFIMTYTLGADGRVVSNERIKDTTEADINIRWILDVVEHPVHGHIYGAAYGDQADNGAAGGIWFLQRSDPVPSANLLRSDFENFYISTPEAVNPVNHAIRVWNAGTTGAALAYTLTSDVPWITVVNPSGTSSSGMPTERKEHQLSFDIGTTAPGTYVGHVSIAAAGQPTITVNVNLVITNNTNLVNTLPQVDAGKNQEINVTQLPVVVTLSGSATDDGLPNPPGYIQYSWVLSGDNNTAVTIDNPHNATTTVTLRSYGIYVFQLHANDGAGVSSSLVTVYLDQIGNKKPNITMMKADQYTVHLGTTVQLSVTAVDDGFPNPPGKLLYTWDRVETGVGIATFATPTLPTTMVSFSEMSSYLCQCTVSDGVQYLWKQLVIIVVAPNVTITDTSAASTGSEEITISSTSSTPITTSSAPQTTTDMSCDASSTSASQTRASTVDTPATTISPPVARSSASSLLVGALGITLAFLTL